MPEHDDVRAKEPTPVDWHPTLLMCVDTPISNRSWLPAASARGQWLESERIRLQKLLSEALDAKGKAEHERDMCRQDDIVHRGTIEAMHKEAAMARADFEALLSERDALKAELADLDEQHGRVMAEECPSDERHCTCVPILRAEYEALKAEVARLTAELAKEAKA